MRFFFTLFIALFDIFTTGFGLMVGGFLIVAFTSQSIFKIIRS